MKRKSILAALVVLLAVPALAGLKVLGEGGARRFDPSGGPPEMKERHRLLETKCANPSCHTLERTVIAVTSGVAPVTHAPFDRKAAKRYGVKMMRKPDSGIDKREAKTLVELLYFLLDEAQK